MANTKLHYRESAVPTVVVAADTTNNIPLTNPEIDANFYSLAVAIDTKVTTGGGAYEVPLTFSSGVSRAANAISVTYGTTAGTVCQGNDSRLSDSRSANGGTAANISGTLAVANGGTNITTYTTGDILYSSATNTLSKLTVGTSADGSVLKLAGGVPTWGVDNTVVPGNGPLAVSIGTAGATNTTVTWGTSSGFSANIASSINYDLKVGPALTNLATLMTTAGAGFIKRGATADTYTIDTNTYLTSYTNTTYTHSAETVVGGGANLALNGSDSTTDNVKFIGSGATTVTRTDANTITISSTDTDTNTDILQSIAADTGSAERYVTFVNSASGAQTGGSSTGLLFNPSTSTLTIGGNLIVNGTTTTINSTTLTVDDKNIELGHVTTPTNATADGGGITLLGGVNGDKTFTWVNGSNAWTSNVSLSAPLLISTASQGTSPLTVSSTTLVSNLNADLLDGQHGSYYYSSGNPPPYPPDTNTTYNHLAVTTTGGALLRLNASTGVNDDVKFASGTNVTVAYTDDNTITISSIDTNTTYDHLAVTTTGGALLRLHGSSGSTDDVKFASSTAVTIVYTDDNTITVNHADTSSVANVNNSGNTFIQDLTFDEYGHVTAVASGTVTDANTTYDHLAVTTTGGALLRLHGSDGSTDDVKFASGTNVTVAYTDDNTITISSTDTNTDTLQSVTDDTTTNATYYPHFVTATSGAQTGKVSSTKLTFNPSTGTLLAANLNIPGSITVGGVDTTPYTDLVDDNTIAITDTTAYNTLRSNGAWSTASTILTANWSNSAPNLKIRLYEGSATDSARIITALPAIAGDTIGIGNFDTAEKLSTGIGIYGNILSLISMGTELLTIERTTDATPVNKIYLPTVGSSGLVRLNASGLLSADTTTYATGTGTASGTNTGDNAVNTLYSGLVSNATHTGDVTGSGALTIAADAVTYAKMQNVSVTNRVLGRITAGAGDVEELTGANLSTIIGDASSTTKGVLSAADWSTFNGKQASGNYFVSGGALSATTGTFTGAITSTGDITAFAVSDRSLKENIQDIPNALDKVDAIGGKTFDWTDAHIASRGGVDDYFVVKSDFGVIAQDVQSVFPVATRTRDDGTLAVDYEKLCALAFAAIKELRAEVELLKGKK